MTKPNPTTPQLNPAIRAILDEQKAAEQAAMAELRKQQKVTARETRLKQAWEQVRSFRGDAIPRELTGEALWREYANRIVRLGSLLKEDGWLEQLNHVTTPANPKTAKAKACAVEALRHAARGELEAVLEIVKGFKDSFFTGFGLTADNWLREGLRNELLGIEADNPSDLPWDWGPAPTLAEVKRLYDEYAEWERTAPERRDPKWPELFEGLRVHPALAELRTVARCRWPQRAKFDREFVQAIADEVPVLTGKNPPDVDEMRVDEVRQLLDGPTPPADPPADPGKTIAYVTLDQMAAIVNRSKRTLERLKYRKANPLPDPDVPGGGGKPDEWDWDKMRPWLEKEYSKHLPKQFPGHIR
jgi:hypothetical protein